jgi:FxsC-like protein
MSGSGQAEHDDDSEQGGPYFFLSYAHHPRIDPDDPGDPNMWVLKLFRDLSQEIMELTDLPAGRQPGFIDRDLRPGYEWSRRITQALATCRVFIPLYSPRYFSSENCGKEWFAFHKRQVEHEANGGRHPEAIVPVLWVPVAEKSLPEVARSLQFDHHRLGEVYVRGGFSQLIKINRYSDDYNEALRTLADHIVRVADHQSPDPAPDKLVDYSNVECAFGSAERKAASNRRLTVTIVADDFYHLPQAPVARAKEYYSAGAPTRWNPYQPESKVSLADYISNIARGMGLVPDVVWFDEASSGAMMDTDDPGLIIIDPWAVLDATRSQRLWDLSQLSRSWTQMLIPWNPTDTQTMLHEGVLRQALERALPSVPTPLPTLRMFGNHLPKAINTVVCNFLRESRPHPPAVIAAAPARMRLLDTDGAPVLPDHQQRSHHRPSPPGPEPSAGFGIDATS